MLTEPEPTRSHAGTTSREQMPREGAKELGFVRSREYHEGSLAIGEQRDTSLLATLCSRCITRLHLPKSYLDS